MITLDTSLGTIVIELDERNAPKTCANFKQYVEEGFYGGTVFHRVIKGFMIQGGGFTPDMKQLATRPSIKNEANNGLKNIRGAVAMARTMELHSATAQFFINIKDNDFLDYPGQNGGYCVFGKVIKGMDVLEMIENVTTVTRAGHQDVPADPIVINNAYANSPIMTGNNKIKKTISSLGIRTVQMVLKLTKFILAKSWGLAKDFYDGYQLPAILLMVIFLLLITGFHKVAFFLMLPTVFAFMIFKQSNDRAKYGISDTRNFTTEQKSEHTSNHSARSNTQRRTTTSTSHANSKNINSFEEKRKRGVVTTVAPFGRKNVKLKGGALPKQVDIGGEAFPLVKCYYDGSQPIIKSYLGGKHHYHTDGNIQVIARLREHLEKYEFHGKFVDTQVADERRASDP